MIEVDERMVQVYGQYTSLVTGIKKIGEEERAFSATVPYLDDNIRRCIPNDFLIDPAIEWSLLSLFAHPFHIKVTLLVKPFEIF